MLPNSHPYIVVEMAGYEGERDVHRSKTYGEAIRWKSRHYGPDELDCCDPNYLHVDICKVLPDGSRTYEI